MATKQATPQQQTDYQLLYAIQKAAEAYGVKDTIVYPCSNLIEIHYHEIGQGVALGDIAMDMIRDIAPNHDYRIKGMPSERKLVVELL